jgi:hypothetical protein
MMCPDHILIFFTVVLSLALAMSIPQRKPEALNAYIPIGEQSILR